MRSPLRPTGRASSLDKLATALREKDKEAASVMEQQYLNQMRGLNDRMRTYIEAALNALRQNDAGTVEQYLRAIQQIIVG